VRDDVGAGRFKEATAVMTTTEMGDVLRWVSIRDAERDLSCTDSSACRNDDRVVG